MFFGLYTHDSSKPVLPKSKYYRAIGIFANAALGRILSDILALSDITAQESHKLSELCRILNALEGLFVEDPDQVSSMRIFDIDRTDFS